MPVLPFGYEKEYDVRFYDCDCTGQIKISAVLRYLSDLAELHYDAKGFGHDFLWEKEMVFLLAGESLRFHRRPRGNERLVFTTWEREIRGARYLRDFEIYDASGDLAVSASTVWLLANPVTRQILRPSVYDFSPDCHPERSADVLPPGRPGKGEGPVFLGRREVRFSDLDNNLHVYNANYADMALDALAPEDAGAPFRDFKIHYVSEARLGDVLLLSRETLPDGGVLIKGEKESGGLCFACEFWGQGE